MSNRNDLCVPSSTSTEEALTLLNENNEKILFVVNEKEQLIGSVTDGDIRRAILKKLSLHSSIESVMNNAPIVVSENIPRFDAVTQMREQQLTHLPILDEAGKIVHVLALSDYNETQQKLDNAIVLMAGGMGQRLQPLTENCPKPLLKLTDKPILETIIDNFSQRGFYNFYISINYLGEQIQNHFGTGSKKNISIDYLEETKRLGTAGALSLLPRRLTQPFIVMNGDLLTNLNFQSLLDFHSENNAAMTICVREYDFQVPYGIVNVDGIEVTSLEEKPTFSFFINAGIYVIDPEVLQYVPNDVYFDMTDLIDILMTNNKMVASFPIKSYWRDIGSHDDYLRAKDEFNQIFG